MPATPSRIAGDAGCKGTQLLTSNRLQIRHRQPEHASRAEYPPTFSEQRSGLWATQMLEHVRCITGLDFFPAEGQSFGYVPGSDLRVDGPHVEVDPRRMPRRTATDVDEQAAH